MGKDSPLWDLIERSVIVQGLVTLGFVAAACYLYISGQEVPQELTHLIEIVLGFWMGTKVTHMQVAHYEKRHQGK